MPRRPRPRYEREIDYDLFMYADSLEIIEHLQRQIRRIAFGDSKYLDQRASSYDSLGTQHMASSASALADIRKIEQAEAVMRVHQNYVTSVRDSIERAFSRDQDAVRFIELYWWERPREPIRVRKAIVTDQMPFLQDRYTGRKPFYNYRRKIYLRLAEIWGYSISLEEMRKECILKKTH